MEGGFFNRSALAAIKPSLLMVPLCGICGLWRHCLSPKMPVSGKGKKKILILAEGPGKTEDSRGIQFCGASGRLLEGFLQRVGINMREDCWLDNSIKCRAMDESGDNRKPTDMEINACRPALTRTLMELKPEVVIPLGKVAIQSLMGIVWKGESVDSINRWVGWKIPEQSFNMWICPNWHPAYLLYEQKRTDGKGNPVLEMYFQRYLRQAADLRGRPWNNNIPKLEVEKIRSPRIAAQEIRGFIERGRMIAWDIETDRIKPDHPEAEVVSCSISDGKKTISYLWEGESVDASLEMVTSRLWKLGQNITFESRWMKTKYGKRVKNWHFDSMLGIHVLDNRKLITGLKFASFVFLGQPPYDVHIKPYFASPDGKKNDNAKNRIHELDKDALLEYGGIDAAAEYRLGIYLMKELNYPMPESEE